MKATDLYILINDFVRLDPGNSIPDGPRIFQDPIVGFARADDAIFDEFKNSDVISPLHRHPTEWLSSAKTVVSYFLPISDDIITSNVEGDSASRHWIFARFWGEALNDRLRRILVARLQKAGYEAVAPLLDPEYEVRDLKSNWSERHVALAAGLGTFGLNRGLITSRGLAGRFGSVVTSLELEPTPRGFDEHFEACPHLAGGTCGECIPRCPAGAIAAEGKDLSICRNYLREVEGPGVRSRLGFPYSPCGKCYVDVPCESGIPSQ